MRGGAKRPLARPPGLAGERHRFLGGRHRQGEEGLEVDWRVADIGGLEAGAREFDAAFDLVLLLFVHTDPEARARWLELARRALAPGGTLVYIGHDRSNIAHGHGGPRNPEVLATPEEIAESLHGLVIERAEVVRRPIGGETGHGPVDAPPGTVALDTLVRARRPPPDRAG